MKNILRYIIIFAFLFFFVSQAEAQGPPPPPPVKDIPLDGGLGILLASGALYGLKKLYSIRNKEDLTPKQ